MPLPRYLDGPRESQKHSHRRSENRRTIWERKYERYRAQQQRYATDRSERMYRKFNQEPVSTEIDPNKRYTPSELDAIASQLLRDDSKTEMCPECGKRGDPTGFAKSVEEDIEDASGNGLVLTFEEFKCKKGHHWFSGEGKERGIGGDNPILFEEHFQSRKRREIYTAQGTPDPSIVSGMYNRVHPNGRKVNSEEQRKRNGASFYR